jgi:hypothetical protein
MKNEKLMSLAAVFGWFGAYLFISIIAVRLPEGVDCAATILALWGLILVCARSFEDKKTLPEMLSHGGINKASLALILFAFLNKLNTRDCQFIGLFLCLVAYCFF